LIHFYKRKNGVAKPTNHNWIPWGPSLQELSSVGWRITPRFQRPCPSSLFQKISSSSWEYRWHWERPTLCWDKVCLPWHKERCTRLCHHLLLQSFWKKIWISKIFIKSSPLLDDFCLIGNCVRAVFWNPELRALIFNHPIVYSLVLTDTTDEAVQLWSVGSLLQVLQLPTCPPASTSL